MKESDRKRFKFLKVCVLAAFFVIAVRLFVIQIVQHDEYVAKAASQHIAENVIQAKRGDIYMMDGEDPVKVVTNETVFTVVVDPLMANREKVEEVLYEI